VSRRIVAAPAAEPEVVEPVVERPRRVVSHFDAVDVGLTPREAEIVGLIVSGLSNREIGERLQLSINSVKTYIRTAYRKIGVERRAQAVLWGIQHGFEPDVLRRVQR
jgi:DNA-binding CsgD family transcriptional regulator